MQHDKTGASFFHEAYISRESISTNLMEHYISDPWESHRVWRITEPVRTRIKKGRGRWC